MITPFDGTKLTVEEDSFNFYQSQVRITIERAFGIFIRRFAIFWKPLQFRLQLVTKIVEACARLHKFCINHNIPDDATRAHAPPPELTLTEIETLPNPIYAHAE